MQPEIGGLRRVVHELAQLTGETLTHEFRKCERHPTSDVLGKEVGALSQQQFHHGQVAADRRFHQQRAAMKLVPRPIDRPVHVGAAGDQRRMADLARHEIERQAGTDQRQRIFRLTQADRARQRRDGLFLEMVRRHGHQQPLGNSIRPFIRGRS
jgi:hypothetical protein